jgi:hypothetical protein
MDTLNLQVADCTMGRLFGTKFGLSHANRFSLGCDDTGVLLVRDLEQLATLNTSTIVIGTARLNEG